MIVQEPASAFAERVTVWLRPNRALSKRHLRRLVLALAAAALGTAWLGSFQGNVYAPLFALIEVPAVAFALGLAWRAGDRGERITLDADALEVCAFPGGRAGTRFPSYWVRVQLRPGHGRQRLLLASHGRELEVGAFLADAEREELLRRLRSLLAERTEAGRRQTGSPDSGCKT